LVYSTQGNFIQPIGRIDVVQIASVIAEFTTNSFEKIGLPNTTISNQNWNNCWKEDWEAKQ